MDANKMHYFEQNLEATPLERTAVRSSKNSKKISVSSVIV